MSQNRNDISMGIAADLLEIGRNTLFKKLRTLGILNIDNSPQQQLIKAGLFTTEIDSYQTNHQLERQYYKTRITLKGLIYLKNILEQQ